MIGSNANPLAWHIIVTSAQMSSNTPSNIAMLPSSTSTSPMSTHYCFWNATCTYPPLVGIVEVKTDSVDFLGKLISGITL